MFKENIKSLVIIVLGIMVTAGVVMAFNGQANIVVEGDMHYNGTSQETYGGVTTEKEYFNDSFIDSGLTLSYSPLATATMTADMICQYKNIEHTFVDTMSSITLYLPTSDALIKYCLQTKNDTWKLYFSNEDAEAATTTTLSIANNANETMELLEADGSDVVIPGDEDAIIEFRNAGNNVVKATVTSVRAAD